MPARLGQNFLVSPGWQERIAAALAAGPRDCVLEIGGGKGELSELIAERAARLTIVEVDRELAAGLRERFRDNPRVSVMEQDILQTDVIAAFLAMESAMETSDGQAADAAAGGEEKFTRRKVFGNLPYYITSPILARLCDTAGELGEAVVMMQREVADRLLARPGGKEYGYLTCLVGLSASTEWLFDLPPGAFQPAPKVTSSLLRLRWHKQEQRVERKAMLEFMRRAFAHKRKSLRNNLKPFYPAQALDEAWRECVLNPQARAEELELEVLARIAKELEPAGAKVKF